MKKTYFNPAAMHFVQHLPKIQSRRMPGTRLAAYKSDASDNPSDDTATEEDLLKKIEQRVQAQLKDVASKEELEAIRNSQTEGLKGLNLDQLRSIADEKTGVLAMMTRQGLEMQRLETKMNSMNKQGEDMSVRAQVVRWMEENKGAIKQIRSGEAAASLKPLDLQMRVVASPMTVATVNPSNSQYITRVEVEPGINDFLRAAPTFWDYLTKGKTNASTYVWVNKTNPQGAAAWIGPGQLKPGVSFEMVTDISNAKKIADSAKATTELLEDIDGMVTMIEQELRYQVMIKVNATLLNNVGSATTPTGIRQLSTTYTLTTIKTTTPNMADAIRAAIAQLRGGLLTGEITVFINPVDSANMDMQKATSSGVYVLPPFMTADGKTIAGAKIVEEAGVPAGFFQAGFMRFYRVLIYKPFTISWGWENDDFTHNLVTVVGEMRLHQFFNQIHTGAFIYDSYARIIPLITASGTTRETPPEGTPEGQPDAPGSYSPHDTTHGGGVDEGNVREGPANVMGVKPITGTTGVKPPDIGRGPVEPPKPEQR